MVRVHAGPLDSLKLGSLKFEVSPVEGQPGTWNLELELTQGGLAQLARAPALQAGGHRFDSDILHQSLETVHQLGEQEFIEDC